MELNLSIDEKLFIKPSQPSKTQTLELSGLDRISPAFVYTVLFYTCQFSSNSEGEVVAERAKNALQKLLVSWFPSAGRFKINEETGKLEINCNDEGVLWITASSTSTLHEFGRLYEYKPCYEKLVPKLPEADDISRNPLVVFQMTRFACGGISIGFGSSHSLFDGTGALSFITSWAHITRGKNATDLTKPNHSRNALMQAIYPSNSSHVALGVSIYEQEHIVAIQDLYSIPMQTMASDDRNWETALAKSSQIDRTATGKLDLMTICIKKEVVETWKGLVTQRSKLTRCSTFDVLCALVWKARVKALNLLPSTNICLQFPVESRRKLRPTLGDNFTGNAFVLASVSCQVKDLLQEPLHNTIHKIQAAKDVITDEYIKLYSKALESSDKFLPSMRELTIVTDWLKFPVHALDFGWGNISSAAILSTPVQETAFVMVNLEEPAGFLIRMGINVEHAETFASYFKDNVYH